MMVNKDILYKIYNILFFVFLGLIIIYGIYYRYHIYVFNADNSFASDECRLAINSLLPWNELFLKLPNSQCTPPVFSLITKFLLNSTTCINESLFRLFPLFVNILSILLFAFLELKIIKNKFAILVGLILFIINQNLTFFSHFYKHYCADVLMSIVLLICAIYIKDRNFNLKELFILGILSCICTLFSYTSAIIIAGIFIAKILSQLTQNQKINIKNCLVYLSPILIYGILLTIFVIIPVKQEGFLDWFWFSHEMNQNHNNHIILSPEYFDGKILENITAYIMSGFFNIKYNSYLFFALILTSLLLFYKQNKFLFYFYIAETIVIPILSLIRIYPFGPDRIILYTIPLFYILLLKSFDITCITKGKIKKNLSLLIVFVMFIYLNNEYRNIYAGIQYTIRQPRVFESSPPKYYYQLLKYSDIKPEDYIYFWQPIEIQFYNKDNLLKINDIHKQFVGERELENIEKNKNIFFYLTKEYIYDNYLEYDFVNKFIRNECKIQYSIFDNFGAKPAYFIKCIKISEAMKHN